jgi:hypothetical protein
LIDTTARRPESAELAGICWATTAKLHAPRTAAAPTALMVGFSLMFLMDLLSFAFLEFLARSEIAPSQQDRDCYW